MTEIVQNIHFPGSQGPLVVLERSQAVVHGEPQDIADVATCWLQGLRVSESFTCEKVQAVHACVQR